MPRSAAARQATRHLVVKRQRAGKPPPELTSLTSTEIRCIALTRSRANIKRPRDAEIEKQNVIIVFASAVTPRAHRAAQVAHRQCATHSQRIALAQGEQSTICAHRDRRERVQVARKRVACDRDATDADDKEAAAEGVGYAVLDALDNSDAEHSFVVGPTVPTLADRQSQLEVRYVVGCSASDRAL